MNKDQVKKWTKYLDKLNNQLQAGPTEKHKDNPATYKAFLTKEIATIKRQLEQAKLEGTVK